MSSINTMDLRKLMQEPSGAARSVLAGKVASDYRGGTFNSKEVAIANDIFRILLKDIEKKVRLAMAEQLCFCPNVPKDIIMQIANDDEDIAVHVLEFSRVLTDEDLLEIVASGEEVSKLRAVARRETISAALSAGLLATGNVSVIADLFRNRGAIITDNALLDAWPTISGSESLSELLVDRGGLSLTIVEKLLLAVSEEFRHRLVKEYKISMPLAAKVTSDAREWELLGFTPANSDVSLEDDEQVEDLIDQLMMSGRLTHSLIIRALCIGSLGLFETGIARLAGIPRVNARLLLSDAGSLGFRSVYHAAAMPVAFEEAIRVLLRISLEESEYGMQKGVDLRKRVVDKIYSSNYHRTIENMEYLLSIIGGKIARESIN